MKGRPAAGDDADQDIEQTLEEVQSAFSTATHSRRRRLITGLLSDVCVCVGLLSVVLVALQVALRGWIAVWRGGDAALYPYADWTVFGGTLHVPTGQSIVLLIAMTSVVGFVAACMLWLVIMAVLHDTWRPWELFYENRMVVPTRGYDEGLQVNYQADGPDRRLTFEASNEALAESLSKAYPAVAPIEDDRPSPLETVTASQPAPLVFEAVQPERLTETAAESAGNYRLLERLMILADRLPCQSEVQIHISNAAEPYSVPQRRAAPIEEPDNPGIIDVIKAEVRALFADAVEDPQLTANIRVVATPRTADEYQSVQGALEAMALTLPETAGIDSMVGPVTPVFDVPGAEPRFPRIATARQRISDAVGTRPAATNTTNQGLTVPLRFWLGALADDESTRSVADAVTDRELRAARHGDARLGNDQPDLLVSQAALAELLVARRDQSKRLSNTLDDDPDGEPLSAATEAAYVASDAEHTAPDAVQTDGGAADEATSYAAEEPSAPDTPSAAEAGQGTPTEDT